MSRPLTEEELKLLGTVPDEQKLERPGAQEVIAVQPEAIGAMKQQGAIEVPEVDQNTGEPVAIKLTPEGVNTLKEQVRTKMKPLGGGGGFDAIFLLENATINTLQDWGLVKAVRQPEGGIGGQEFKTAYLTPKGQRFATEMAITTAAVAVNPALGAESVAARLGIQGIAGAGASLVSEVFDPTENPLATAGETAFAASLGEFIPAVVKKPLAAGAGKFKQGAITAFDMLQKKGSEFTVTVGQALDDTMFSLAETIARAGLASAGKVRKTTEAAEMVLEDVADDFVAKFGTVGSVEEAGVLVQQLLKDGSKESRAGVRAAYKAVDEKIGQQGLRARVKKLPDDSSPAEFNFKQVDPSDPNTLLFSEVPKVQKDIPFDAGVDFRSVKEFAEKRLAEVEQGVKSQNSTTINLLQDIISKPDTVTFDVAQILKSDLGKVSGGSEELVKGRLKGLGRKMSQMTRNSMEDSAKRIGGGVFDQWKLAEKMNGVKQSIFSDKVIAGMMKKDPEKVFDSIVTKNNSATIERLKRASELAATRNKLPKDFYWGGIQAQFIDDWWLKGGGSGTKLLSTLKAQGGGVPGVAATRGGTAEAIMGKGAVEGMKDLARTLQIVQSQPSSKLFDMGFKIVQAGTVASLIYGGVDGTDALGVTAVLLGPKVLAKLVTSPKVLKLMRDIAQGGKANFLKSKKLKLINALFNMGAVTAKTDLTPEGVKAQDVGSDVLF